MKKFLVISAVTFCFLTNSEASTIKECKGTLDAARTSLVDMMGGKKDDTQQKLVKSSAEAADKCFRELQVDAKFKADADKLKETWSAFFKTRVSELVPLILSSKPEDNAKAKEIGTGIQGDRMKQMKQLISKIAGDE